LNIFTTSSSPLGEEVPVTVELLDTVIQLIGYVDVSAGILAIAAGGALSSVKTTVLLSADEGMAAIKKAAEISYQPPGS